MLEASSWPDPSYHIWIFFDPPIEAKYAKALGEMIRERIGEPDLEEKAPEFLGAILDVLAEALSIYPTIKLRTLNRMANYTL